MNTFYYIVETIDGDYANLRQIDENGNIISNDLKLVARALLPAEITEGCKLINEMLQYRML